MINIPVLESIQSRINLELDAANNIIMTGVGVKDFSDYRYAIGHAKGLADANAIIVQVLEALGKPEEEAK